ncbi:MULTISPECIES: DUF1329 domain-containing protein [Pseudomonas]|jgi:hypothetical protein|nr:hypothetical protein FG99_02750 [Pseudomonas sp. AAC]KSW27326.1 hypothetical protein AOX63_27500 [Pseudomonas sp. ADP]KWR76608.1 hypothetical protein RN02_20280 [Pseudomonas sp. PI1]MBH3434679.1 DUF1329 domain-containing protein [Pseudomonas citronellolis]OBP10078.1 outer membrane lipoprotein-sorting protein [Pseudomonas sp. EGD-AKN5]OHR85213.1 hypothetical protein HMPREF3289_25910 [Pseudomonas sp. HMSC75E02]QOF83988.1 DUF1329 domain-containing protein [Pseudomonas sp. ADPe]
MIAKKPMIALLALAALVATDARAAVSADQAAQLKSSLTPLGAEKAGNAAGSIPAWSGGLTQAPAGYKGPGSHHVDPFAGDKPQFTITKANLEQYKANLTPGQIALFNTYPDSFQMPVYQTRRSGAAPQWVYDNTFRNATSGKLVEGGNGFADAYGGIPFPIPQSGLEALWNHIARYRGSYIERRSAQTGVQRNGAYSLVTSQDAALFRFYDPKGSFEQLGNTLFYYMTFTTAPARLAGEGALVQETLDQVKEPRQAWGYSPGQRRVRRAPTLAYDTPIEDSDGLRTADDTDMYNGAPDRYNWTLVGKKEIYIPYNNYRVTSPEVKYKDLLTPGHINPKYTRYELHRVWVVEGKLKPGARHIYSKRTLYLDEDSWGAAVVDQYDGRGELWRVSMAYLKNFYEQPMVWTALDTFHDLQSRRYSVQWLDNEEPGTADFSKPAPDVAEFSPAALRRKASR